jgi:hypothetical protein
MAGSIGGRPALHSPDTLVKGRKIDPLHAGPDRAHRMVLGDQRFQVTGPQLDLGTVGPLVARRCALHYPPLALLASRNRCLLFVKQWDVHFALPPWVDK